MAWVHSRVADKNSHLRPGERAALASLVGDQLSLLSTDLTYHTLELEDGNIIPGIIPIADLRDRISRFPIPLNLHGKRVLDIGAASGFNSFELEHRGADVVAVDCVPYEELIYAKNRLRSKIEYCVLDLEEVTPERFGMFDFVVFFGVLYHLRHPLLALEIVSSVTAGTACIESFVEDSLQSEDPLMAFYETVQLGGAIDNWWGPSAQCLTAMVRAAGFVEVACLYERDSRAGVIGHTKGSRPTRNMAEAPAPFLSFVTNSRDHSQFFTGYKDEYLCISFRHTAIVNDRCIRIEMDDYSLPVITVHRLAGEAWQVNARLPRGLAAGKHRVRIGVRGGLLSEAAEIFVQPRCNQFERSADTTEERKLSEAEIRVLSVETSVDTQERRSAFRADYLSVYFMCPQQNISATTIKLYVDDALHAVLAVGRFSSDTWQLNARIPKALAAGRHDLHLGFGGAVVSNSASFLLPPAIEDPSVRLTAFERIARVGQQPRIWT